MTKTLNWIVLPSVASSAASPAILCFTTLLHTACVYELGALSLEGPADTHWKSAFIQFVNE